MLECVVNVSEGRRADVVDRLAAACGTALLDVHTDADHHRTVFTLGAADPQVTRVAAQRLTRAAAAALSLGDHDGVHPRLGVVDVVPFVALDPTHEDVAIHAATEFATWAATELGVPVFLYDDADPERRTLPSVRRDAFVARVPDAGPPVPHPELGAIAVGARRPLVAVNLELARGDLVLARQVASQLRERDGGLPGVRALGLPLPSVGRAQVSMNLVDLDATGLEAACVAARELVEAGGGSVARVELVGLVPAAALAGASAAFLTWSGIGPDRTVEARAAATATGGLGAGAAGGAGTTPGAGPASPA